jgi:hypothetical protein
MKKVRGASTTQRLFLCAGIHDQAGVFARESRLGKNFVKVRSLGTNHTQTEFGGSA